MLLFCSEPANQSLRMEHELVVKVMSVKVAETVTKPSGKIRLSLHHILGMLKQKEIPRHLREPLCILLSFILQSSFPFPPQMTEQNRMFPKKTHLEKLSSGSVFFYFIFHLRVSFSLYPLG